MKNFIGNFHDTRNLTDEQLKDFESRIKNMLKLDTIHISRLKNGFYSVMTDDNNIIDFKIDSYDRNKVLMVKYRSYNEQGQRDNAGATLTFDNIIASE